MKYEGVAFIDMIFFVTDVTNQIVLLISGQLIGVVKADMPIAWLSCLYALRFVTRTLHVDLARFINGIVI